MTAFSSRMSFVLLAILLALLPFHAFLYTWLHSIFWTDSWMIIVQAWKEIIVALLALFACGHCIRQPKKILTPLPLATLTLLGLAGLYLLIGPGELTQKMYGLRTLTLPWVALLAVSLTPISDTRKRWLEYLTLGAAGIVVIAALTQKFILPTDFLAAFGYSTVVSTWLPGGNLPMYQLVGGTNIIRAQSTFAGPNQLAAYLLVITPLIASGIISAIRLRENKAHLIALGTLLVATLATILLTYSRAAWLGLIAMAGVAALAYAWDRWRTRGLIALLIVGIIGSAGCISVVATNDTLRETITRSASTSEHLTRTIAAARVAITHPLGLGLGQAAGVSQRFDESETRTGLTPENTYLGIALELGWLGVVAFVTLLIILSHELSRARSPILFSLIGVAVVMLFLHPLEDAPTALTLAILAGISVRSRRL